MRAIIFDMDGVIADTESLSYEATKKALADLGKNMTREFFVSIIGRTEKDCHDAICEEYKLDEKQMKTFRRGYKTYYLESLTTLKPNSGLNRLLDNLRANDYKIALASSSNKEQIHFILEKLNIADYFDVIVSGEDVKRGKPHPDIFMKAVTKLNVGPKKCIVIEDSKHGVEAANRINLKCIALNTPFFEHDAKDVHLIIDSLDELRPEVINLLNMV